jgi:hypothetical protein
MNLSELSFTELQDLHAKIVTAIEQQQAAEKPMPRNKFWNWLSCMA